MNIKYTMEESSLKSWFNNVKVFCAGNFLSFEKIRSSVYCFIILSVLRLMYPRAMFISVFICFELVTLSVHREQLSPG